MEKVIRLLFSRTARRKIFITTIFITNSIVSSIACFNGDTKTLKDGTIISMDKEDGIIPLGHHFFTFKYDEKLIELDSIWKATKDVDYLSDYALVLSLKEEYEKAKTIYLEIENSHPGRYSTASNLGTLYELTGQNEEALKWIRKAVKIDPHSHNDSEWIHIKILEAKIKGNHFINSEFLLNMSFGKEAIPITNLSQKKLIALRTSLYYQLNERVSFIKTNDKIIARLMFELGNIAVLTNQKAQAISIYEIAAKYGFSEPILTLRVNYAKGEINSNKESVLDSLNKDNLVVLKTDTSSNSQNKVINVTNSSISNTIVWFLVALGVIFMVLVVFIKIRKS